jgi:urease accessory protein
MTGALGPLLHADPAFAAGAGSFSSGLETLVADGFVTDAATLTAFLVDAVRLRWNRFDRVLLVRSHGIGAADDDGRREVDREAELSTVGAAARAASRRAGIALLGTWARLGLLDAARYRDLARRTPGAGHLAVAQGLVHRAHELTLAESEALACWALLSSSASGAIRLGVVGHRAAQNALLDARRAVEPLLAEPVHPDAVPEAFTPVTDIAVERHALSDLKLFVS